MTVGERRPRRQTKTERATQRRHAHRSRAERELTHTAARCTSPGTASGHALSTLFSTHTHTRTHAHRLATHSWRTRTNAHADDRSFTRRSEGSSSAGRRCYTWRMEWGEIRVSLSLSLSPPVAALCGTTRPP